MLKEFRKKMFSAVCKNMVKGALTVGVLGASLNAGFAKDNHLNDFIRNSSNYNPNNLNPELLDQNEELTWDQNIILQRNPLFINDLNTNDLENGAVRNNTRRILNPEDEDDEDSINSNHVNHALLNQNNALTRNQNTPLQGTINPPQFTPPPPPPLFTPPPLFALPPHTTQEAFQEPQHINDRSINNLNTNDIENGELRNNTRIILNPEDEED